MFKSRTGTFENFSKEKFSCAQFCDSGGSDPTIKSRSSRAGTAKKGKTGSGKRCNGGNSLTMGKMQEDSAHIYRRAQPNVD